MRARIVLAAVLLAGLAPLFARAHHGDVVDGNDTRGLLDVRKVETFGVMKPGWRIITFKDWRAQRVWDHGHFLVYLDTFGDERFDYYALVSSFGHGMQGRLWRDRAKKPDRELGQVPVWRKDERSVSVRVPLRRVHFPQRRLFIRWYVQSLWTSSACRRVCFDIVPHRNGVIEPVRPTPTTTPTPTVTPTPTPTVTPTPSP